jgi:tRNA pseudouridine55 synthase
MPSPSLRSGIHLVHKPVGVTSFSIVREWMEEAAKAPKKLPLCHGGTLDPFAEGLLLILVGQATRLMELLHTVPKGYVAEVEWGRETDNGDLLGQTTFEGDASKLTPEMIDRAIQPFLGWHDQVPPATSAKKIDGEPAYKKAHRGEEVVLPPSRVYLHEAKWLAHDLPRRSTLFIRSKGGFYVRALARDLGRALGCGAHLSKLKRTEIGPWRDPAQGQSVLVSGRGLLPWCASRSLTSDEAKALSMGQSIPLGTLPPPEWTVPAGYPDPGGPVRGILGDALVALLREESGRWHSFANLRGGL